MEEENERSSVNIQSWEVLVVSRQGENNVLTKRDSVESDRDEGETTKRRTPEFSIADKSCVEIHFDMAKDSSSSPPGF
jgi:hypothetical protein